MHHLQQQAMAQDAAPPQQKLDEQVRCDAAAGSIAHLPAWALRAGVLRKHLCAVR